MDFTTPQGFDGIVTKSSIGAQIPHHDGPGAVVTGSDGAFKSAVFERVIFHLNSQAPITSA